MDLWLWVGGSSCLRPGVGAGCPGGMAGFSWAVGSGLPSPPAASPGAQRGSRGDTGRTRCWSCKNMGFPQLSPLSGSLFMHGHLYAGLLNIPFQLTPAPPSGLHAHRANLQLDIWAETGDRHLTRNTSQTKPPAPTPAAPAPSSGLPSSAQ